MYLNKSRTPVRKQRTPKWPFVVVAVFVIAILAGAFLIVGRGIKKEGSSTAKAKTAQTFNKQQYSLDDPTSAWVVVNKLRVLNPKTYAPSNLVTPSLSTSGTEQVNAVTADALQKMADAAKTEGLTLTLESGYRSYDTQVSVYNSEVKGYGQAQADRESARPGHSEHQSGWAADLGAGNGRCRVQLCFADTPEGKWLAANAYKYGFIIRYPKGKENITGYEYEPWHVRYVGVELSTEMHRVGTLTLEEFFGLPPAPSY